MSNRRNGADRSAWITPYRGGVSPSDRDRNRGAALPSALNTSSFARIAQTLEAKREKRAAMRRQWRGEVPPTPALDVTVPRRAAGGQRRTARSTTETRRFASVAAVTAAGFKRVASCMYKQGHDVWELRGADGGGYELVRKREERAVDLRQAAGGGMAPAVEAGIIRTAQAEGGDGGEWLGGDAYQSGYSQAMSDLRGAGPRECKRVLQDFEAGRLSNFPEEFKQGYRDFCMAELTGAFSAVPKEGQAEGELWYLTLETIDLDGNIDRITLEEGNSAEGLRELAIGYGTQGPWTEEDGVLVTDWEPEQDPETEASEIRWTITKEASARVGQAEDFYLFTDPSLNLGPDEYALETHAPPDAMSDLGEPNAYDLEVAKRHFNRIHVRQDSEGFARVIVSEPKTPQAEAAVRKMTGSKRAAVVDDYDGTGESEELELELEPLEGEPEPPMAVDEDEYLEDTAEQAFDVHEVMHGREPEFDPGAPLVVEMEDVVELAGGDEYELGPEMGEPDLEGEVTNDGMEMTGKAPPGEKWERLVKELKKDPDVDNPYAVAWAQYNESTGKRGQVSEQETPAEAAQILYEKLGPYRGTYSAFVLQIAENAGMDGEEIIQIWRGLDKEGASGVPGAPVAERCAKCGESKCACPMTARKRGQYGGYRGSTPEQVARSVIRGYGKDVNGLYREIDRWGNKTEDANYPGWGPQEFAAVAQVLRQEADRLSGGGQTTPGLYTQQPAGTYPGFSWTSRLKGQRILAVRKGAVAEGIVLELLPLGDLLADFGEGPEELASDMVLEPELDLETLEVEDELCEDCSCAPCECALATEELFEEEEDEAEEAEDDEAEDEDEEDEESESETEGEGEELELELGGGGEPQVLVITVDDVAGF